MWAAWCGLSAAGCCCVVWAEWCADSGCGWSKGLISRERQVAAAAVLLLLAVDALVIWFRSSPGKSPKAFHTFSKEFHDFQRSHSFCDGMTQADVSRGSKRDAPRKQDKIMPTEDAMRERY